MSEATVRGSAGRRWAFGMAAATALSWGCGGGGGTLVGAAAPIATEAEWIELAAPRPVPLDGTARVTVGEIRILGAQPWGLDAGADVQLGLAELVSAGLLRRRDVRFVERRRFAAAAERERRGLPRPQGAPPAGVSPGAELILTGTWATVGMASGYLDMRLVDTETGDVRSTWRTTTAPDADPIGLARAIVGGLLSALDELGRRPAWTDPMAAAAPDAYRPSGVDMTAVAAFLRGLAAEERWDWEGARRGYQTAASAGEGFFEAEVALARAARLRLGGTLAES